MPAVPTTKPTRMPKGLSPEEQKAYQKARNAAKQRALRERRRAAALQAERDAEEEASRRGQAGGARHDSTSSSSSGSITDATSPSLPSPSESACGASMESTEREREKGKAIFESLMRTGREVAALKETVGRLVTKLAEVGVEDAVIQSLLIGQEGSSTSSSPATSFSESPGDMNNHLLACSLAHREEKHQQQSFLDLLASASSSSEAVDRKPNVSPSVPSTSSAPQFRWSKSNAFAQPTASTSYALTSPSLSPDSNSSVYDAFTSLGPLNVDTIRSALDITIQPVPYSLSSTFSPTDRTADAFFGGGSFWDASTPCQYFPEQPTQSKPFTFTQLPLQRQGTGNLPTLFELHRSYRSNLRRSKLDPSYVSSVSDTVIKELQITILRSLFSTSDQRAAYLEPAEPLTPAEQAFWDSTDIDERVKLCPSQPKMKVIMGKYGHLFDYSWMFAEVIDGTRIYGDVFDQTGWIMPDSFWDAYPANPPAELANTCKAGDPKVFPPGLRGATIREIVLKLEEPGWRIAGPFPLVSPLDLGISWLS